MNSSSPTPPAGRETPAARPGPDSSPTKTPNADMQADDVGTADSGAPTPPDSGTAATPAMEQTSKTKAESSKRR